MTRRLSPTLALLLLGCGTQTVVAVSKGAEHTETHPGSIGDGGAGYLHASGAQIVDASGNPVEFKGLSWFGLETPNYSPHGLWTRSMASVLDQIKSLGFDTLRIPFSSQLLDAASTPNSIDFNLNPDLVGLSGLQIMDKLIDGAGARGLRVILDRHQPASGSQSALWYTDQYSDARFIDDWKQLAARYASNDIVIGFDLATDLQDPATWGDGNAATDWRAAAERAGNAVLSIDPDVLILVEGVVHANGAAYWRGGNLQGVATSPVRLSIPDKLVYATQDYPESVGDQPWFHDATYPENLPGVWDANWGYLVNTNVAPVILVGFGTRAETTEDQQWLTALTSYIHTKHVSFVYWCLNPDSGDTGGILEDDWQTVAPGPMAGLQGILGGG